MGIAQLKGLLELVALGKVIHLQAVVVTFFLT